mgnify:CR=1 FL=1
MKLAIFTLLLALGATISHAQSDLKRLPFIDDDLKHYSAEIVSFSPGEIYVVWSKFRLSGAITFYLHKSSDDGASWNPLGVVFDTVMTNVTEDPYKSAVLIKGANNRLLLFIKIGHNRMTIWKYSDDGGITWSGHQRLRISDRLAHNDYYRTFSAIHHGNGRILLFSSNSLNVTNSVRSSDNGLTWSTYASIGGNALLNPSLLSNAGLNYYMAGQQPNTDQGKQIWFMKNDSIAGWKDTTLVYSHPSDILLTPRLFRAADNSLMIYFVRKQKAFNKYNIASTWYCRSTNEGATWSEPVQLTRYAGDEGIIGMNGQSVSPFFTVSSDRGGDMGSRILHWGNAATLADTMAPPVIYSYALSKDTLRPGDSVSVKLYAGEGSPIISAGFKGTLNGNPSFFPLYDDGQHNDSLAGDKIFGNTIVTGDYYDVLAGRFFVASRYDTTSTAQVMIIATIPVLSQTDVLKTGRLIVPFNSVGEIGAVATPYGEQVRFDSIPVIASQGFLFSGYFNSQVWAAGTTGAFLFKDFQAGTVDYPSNDPRRGIYRIARADSAFGTSWKWWKIAVSMGARYWDGDGNGYYDPIDLNSNGIWEPSEDMPEILGEVSYFTVYNDGVSSTLRRFQEDPKGVEVRQTLYAWPSSNSEQIKNALFVRYEIVNRSPSGQPITDFIFSVQQDPDLGEVYSDLIHSDSVHNSMVIYNSGADGLFGGNPPAIYNTLLFGEPVYVPGISFIDINLNSIWDPGIDTPIDTAMIPLGYPFEPLRYPGAVNGQMASAVPYMSSHPTQGVPNNSTEARNYMTGRNKNGVLLEPCTWPFGTVRTPVNCERVNPMFIYSGDPVSNTGWINNTETDALIALSSGKKTLEPGATFTYHTSIAVQRGNSALNSVTLTRAAVDTIFKLLGASYVHVPTSVKEAVTELPLTWELSQNFPNPFNPLTVIRYELPVAGMTTIKVYDITGALLKVLVSEELPAGKHEVAFDASELASGIYFYRLESGGYSMTRKMVLLR